MTITRRRFVLGASTIAVVGQPAISAYAQPLKTVTVGNTAPSAYSWPLLVASNKGFYTDEGLKVETVYSGSPAASTQQLIGGSVDIAIVSYETGIRAIAGGAQLSFVGGMMLGYPYIVMASPDIKTAADLKGKRVVLTTPRSVLNIFWRKWLRDSGVDPATIEYVYDPSTPNRFAALRSGTVKAAVLGQPFTWRAEEFGAKPLFDLGEATKGYGFEGIAARRDWLAKDPDTMRAYLRATSKAIKFLYKPSNRTESIDILVRDAKVEQALADKSYNHYFASNKPFDEKLDIPDQKFQLLLTTLQELGDVTGLSTDVAHYVSRAYLPQS